MACNTVVGKSVPSGDLVGNTGTPADNQVAVFTAANTIEGNSNFTFDSSTGELGITGLLSIDNIQINGNTIISTDTNGDILLDPNGTGKVQLGNFVFQGNQTVEAAKDKYVLTYDHANGQISLDVFKLTIKKNTNTAWTLALANINSHIQAANFSAITITVPPNSSVAFPVGCKIFIEQNGTGAITMSPGSGVTLNAANNYLSTSTQYEVLELVKMDTDVWTVTGGTA